MAAAAIATEAILVRIVMPMTLLALLGRQGFQKGRLLVARRALKLIVDPFQRESTNLAVVKRGMPPTGRIVATLTLRAHRTPMRVVRFVTADALTGRIVEGKRGVAQRALQRRMLANQRKGGERVVKAHAYRPTRFVVAAPATVTQLPLMGVVGGMATCAVPGHRV